MMADEHFKEQTCFFTWPQLLRAAPSLTEKVKLYRERARGLRSLEESASIIDRFDNYGPMQEERVKGLRCSSKYVLMALCF
jgi:hypothetical protein